MPGRVLATPLGCLPCSSQSSPFLQRSLQRLPSQLLLAKKKKKNTTVCVTEASSLLRRGVSKQLQLQQLHLVLWNFSTQRRKGTYCSPRLGWIRAQKGQKYLQRCHAISRVLFPSSCLGSQVSYSGVIPFLSLWIKSLKVS